MGAILVKHERVSAPAIPHRDQRADRGASAHVPATLANSRSSSVIDGGYGETLEPVLMFPIMRTFSLVPLPRGDQSTFSTKVVPFVITGSLAITQGAMTVSSRVVLLDLRP
jgi:hypothetical protein